jgi:ribosomal protein S18 acetylase RimI-like enzyme
MVEFVEFSEKNIQELTSLIQLTIKKCYPECYSPRVIDFFIEYHNPKELLRKATEGSMLLAFNNNKLVASGYLVENELGGLYVHPDYQNQGIGRQMVQQLINQAYCNKLDSVWLTSTPLAVKLYEQEGFKTIEEKEMVLEGGESLAYYYMRKGLRERH